MARKEKSANVATTDVQDEMGASMLECRDPKTHLIPCWDCNGDKPVKIMMHSLDLRAAMQNPNSFITFEKPDKMPDKKAPVEEEKKPDVDYEKVLKSLKRASRDDLDQISAELGLETRDDLVKVGDFREAIKAEIEKKYL